MTPEQEAVPHAARKIEFPIVGIGASAGGLQPLIALFEGLPANPGMAFVIVLHLSPTHDSTIDSILQRSTKMPVNQVEQATAIEPDHVYVIPPNKQLAMGDGALQPVDLPPRHGRPVTIDVFFRALAQAHRERAVGIVLSGTGSDGAVGIVSLKEHGGLALAQDPLEAEHGDMPRNAIATGAVDLVLSVHDMPRMLLDLWANARQVELPDSAADAPPPQASRVAQEAEAALRNVLSLLKARTGHDFKHYKRATLLRRLERRMQVTQRPNLTAYHALLDQRNEESHALLQDLLISVTNFYRDREAFDALEAALGRGRFESLGPDAELRVWVPGCATGEEAYSVAMLLAERGGTNSDGSHYQLFATDIDQRAIAVARAGRYPDSIAVDVSPTRLDRFFTHHDGRYAIKKPMRERIVFAAHNLLRDPPFSRLDLICCRNLLIYLERDIQHHVLELFHFALQPGGLLFLGSSESADLVPHLFAVVDKKQRLYRALPSDRTPRPTPALVAGQAADFRPVLPHTPLPSGTTGEPGRGFPALHDQLLQKHATPSVLVDSTGNILHVSEGAERYLAYPAGKATHQVLTIVLPELRGELRTALLKSRRSRQPVLTRRLLTQRGGDSVMLVITVRPVDGHPDGDPDADPSALVQFVESPISGSDREAQAPAAVTDQVTELEAELQRLGDRLQHGIGDWKVSTEELRASNEELQAINEELRSTTEELETSKEELQSVNEELVTVNAELKSKVDETVKVNDDLQNLIASTDIATVFVDGTMRIKRYTPNAAEVFSIAEADIGRSLLDIKHRLSYDTLAADLQRTFETLNATERELQAHDGRRYLLRVLPYRTAEDRIDGTVLTFVDISAHQQAEAAMRAREERMWLVAESTKDFAIITMDVDGRVTTWNQGAQRMFGYDESEVVGLPIDFIFTAEDRAAGMPQREKQQSLDNGRAEDERWHLRKDGSTFYCSGVMTPLVDGELRGFAKIARDLTQNKLFEGTRESALSAEQQLRAELQAANARKDEFLAVMSHELKNPLNLIQINVELLARLPDVRGIAAVQRATDIIRRTVRSQAQIIDDLLDMSRMHTGKLALMCAPMDFQPVVRRIVEAVRRDADVKKIELTFDGGEQALTVHADAVRVEQIVWNLVSNALKFTPAGGQVAVRLSRDGALARLDVVDSGRGIEQALLDHVFEMFHQADTGAGREQGGLGIGLALVRSLAELHGGRAEVDSAGLGKGSRFTVWLPLADVQLPPGASQQAPGSLAGLRMLVVDDATDMLESFAQLLQLEGALVTTAASSADALAKAEATTFDLLLSDVAMPGMDGYELIGELRRNPRTAALPAIALTGLGRKRDEAQAMKAGFDTHLAKPVAMGELVEAILRIRPFG